MSFNVNLDSGGGGSSSGEFRSGAFSSLDLDMAVEEEDEDDDRGRSADRSLRQVAREMEDDDKDPFLSAGTRQVGDSTTTSYEPSDDEDQTRRGKAASAVSGWWEKQKEDAADRREKARTLADPTEAAWFVEGTNLEDIRDEAAEDIQEGNVISRYTAVTGAGLAAGIEGGTSRTQEAGRTAWRYNLAGQRAARGEGFDPDEISDEEVQQTFEAGSERISEGVFDAAPVDRETETSIPLFEDYGEVADTMVGQPIGAISKAVTGQRFTGTAGRDYDDPLSRTEATDVAISAIGGGATKSASAAGSRFITRRGGDLADNVGGVTGRVLGSGDGAAGAATRGAGETAEAAARQAGDNLPVPVREGETGLVRSGDEATQRQVQEAVEEATGRASRSGDDAASRNIGERIMDRLGIGGRAGRQADEAATAAGRQGDDAAGATQRQVQEAVEEGAGRAGRSGDDAGLLSRARSAGSRAGRTAARGAGRAASSRGLQAGAVIVGGAIAYDALSEGDSITAEDDDGNRWELVFVEALPETDERDGGTLWRVENGPGSTGYTVMVGVAGRHVTILDDDGNEVQAEVTATEIDEAITRGEERAQEARDANQGGVR